MIEHTHSQETLPYTEKTPQLNESEIKDIHGVMLLQQKHPEYVVPQSEELLIDLYQKNLLMIGKTTSGEVVASFYQAPFDGSDNVFYLGGISCQDTFDAKKTLVSMLDEFIKHVDIDRKIIGSTTNEAFAKYFVRQGFVEMPFEKMKEKYPEVTDLYVKSHFSKQWNYEDKNFYILH